MILEQEHIINKVFLEVETNSTKVAHDLKDYLGMFLKEDILPYLENYFKSIEQQLPAEIVQIPQLTLDIKVNSQNDFDALKTETKEKLVQKIATILKSPSQATEEVVLINTQEHQARSLLFFIENGYTPWWKTASDTSPFTQKEMKEIAALRSFSDRFTHLLQKPISKQRCIQQFTDQELHLLLTATFKHTKEGMLIHGEFIKALGALSSVSRDFIWSEVITYMQSKNIKVLIEKLSSVLIKPISMGDVRVYAFAKAVLNLIQQGFNIAKTETISVLQKENITTSQKKETIGSQLITVFDAVGLSKEANAILIAVPQNSSPSFIKEKETPKQEESQDKVAIEVVSKPNKEELLEIQNKEGNKEKKEPEEEKESNTAFNNENNKHKSHIAAREEKTHVADETPSSKADVKTIDTAISISNKKSEEDTQDSIHKEISQKNIVQQYEEFSHQFDHESVKDARLDTYINEITSQKEEVFITNTGSYQVPNAGLIILHPYLKPFFYNCGIIDDSNTIIDPEVAVHTLHYLATKKEQQLESQMLFEKFLCGVPLKKPIQRQVQLSETIKQQAEELLESVIENWGVLNNASPDLVRHEFLQRAGTLSFKEDNPKIVIERKTQDILVDKLPWGIGICRLPWLDHLVYTNW